MRPEDRTVVELAGKRHGVVSRRLLLAAGRSPEAIKRRVRSGALLAEHRGVDRVAHRAPSREARYVAAVDACGAGALLCGPAGAHLHGLLRGAAPPPDVIRGANGA
jgi:Transcriptional regulator, AbiEi antitoxin